MIVVLFKSTEIVLNKKSYTESSIKMSKIVKMGKITGHSVALNLHKELRVK